MQLKERLMICKKPLQKIPKLKHKDRKMRHNIEKLKKMSEAWQMGKTHIFIRKTGIKECDRRNI